MNDFEVQEISTGYVPRPYQADMHIAMSVKRFGILVFHRRAGKTIGVVNELLDKSLVCEKDHPQYAYIAPTYGQAKRIAWNVFKKYSKMIPLVEYHEGELKITIHRPHRKDFSIIYLLGAENPDSLAGLYLDGVVLDEYSLMNPIIWTLIVRPALSDRKGWALFIGTTRGMNHFHELYQFALKHPEHWYARLMTVADTKAIDEDELALLRDEMPEEQYLQEYMCSWNAALTGAYYGKYISDLEKANKITNVSYDPSSFVSTAWDLGVGDTTAIWFFQIIGTEVHIIDYYESSGQGLDHYVKKIKEKPYMYDVHHLPHDARARSLETGTTREETLRALKLGRINIIPKLAVEDGIHAARMVLPRCWFDAVKCERGLAALKNYQKKWDAKAKIYLDTPLHDWSSNGADAFRYLSLSIRPKRAIMNQSSQTFVVDAEYTILD